MASKEEVAKLLLGSFEGTQAEKNRLINILEKADFFQKDYGVLAYTLAEMQTGGEKMTTAVQNFVAGKVSEQFDAVYNQYLEDFNAYKSANRAGQPTYNMRSVLDTFHATGQLNEPLSRAHYFAKNPSAIESVLDRPIDLGWGRDQKNSITGRTAGEIMPHAFRAETVHEAMTWLGKSEFPQVLSQLIHQESNPDGTVAWRYVGGNFMDEVQTAFEGGLRSITNYKPPVPGSKNNFTVHFGSAAQKAVELLRKDERALSSGKISLGLFDSGEEGGDTSFPGDGGGVDFYRAPIDTSGGISADNSFTQRSYFPNNSSLDAKVHEALVGVQKKYWTEDVFGAYSTLNVQTGQKEDPFRNEPGKYGAGKVNAYEYGYDPHNVQVFGIDPNSPAGKMGMKEGAFIQSFQRILNSPDLGDIVDAYQNSRTSLLAYEQPDANGNLTEYVTAFTPGPIIGRSADQGLKDNWVHQLARSFDPEMGRNMFHIEATWQNTGTRENPVFKQIQLPGALSRTDGHTAIPTELWTTDAKYSSGLYRDNDGNWSIAPLTNQPSDKFGTRVYLDPQAIDTYGDLYENWHDVWTDQKGVYKSLEKKALTISQNLYDQAVKRGGNIPALDTIFQNQYKQLLVKEGFDPGYVSFAQSGVLLEQELRRVGASLHGASAVVEIAQTNDKFDDWVNSLAKQEQPWARKAVDEFTRFPLGSENEDSWIEGGIIRRPEVRKGRAVAEWLLPNQGPKTDIPGQGLVIAGTGHRPDELGGYNNLQDYGNLIKIAARQLDQLKPSAVISGGAQGWDQALAEAAINKGIPTAFMLPYEGYGEQWPAEAQAKLAKLISRAERAGGEKFTLSGPLPDHLDKAGRADLVRKLLDDRNRAMIGNAGMTLALYNNIPGGTANGVKFSLESGVPVKNVWGEYSFGETETKIYQEWVEPPLNLDEEILGGSPAWFAENDPGEYLMQGDIATSGEDFVRNRTLYSAQRGPDPIDLNAINAFAHAHPDKAREVESLSVEEINRRPVDGLLNLRQQNSTDDPRDELDDISENAASGSVERAFYDAINAIANPDSDRASNSARSGRFGSVYGYHHDKGKVEEGKPSWRTTFDQANAAHPENGESFGALGNVYYGPQHEAVKQAGQAELNRIIGDARAIGREDVIAHIRLGETPRSVREARASKSGNPRQALQQISNAYDLGLSFQRGKEADLAEQLEKMQGGDLVNYERLRSSVLADPSRQLQTAREWSQSLRKVSRTPTPQAAAQHQAITPEQIFQSLQGKFIQTPINQVGELARQSVGNIAQSMLSDVYSAGSVVNPETHIAMREGGAPWYWSMYGSADKQTRKNFHRNVVKRLEDLIAGKDRGDDLTQTLKGEIYEQLTGLSGEAVGNPDPHFMRGFVARNLARTRMVASERVSRAGNPEEMNFDEPPEGPPDWTDLPMPEGDYEEAAEMFDMPNLSFLQGRNAWERQSAAAYTYMQQTGDREGAQKMLLYPVAQGNTLQPSRNFPHFASSVDEQFRQLFTNPDVEEGGFLVGRNNQQGGVDIIGAVKPKQNSANSQHNVKFTPAMSREAVAQAEAMGGFLAGTIHTHPTQREGGANLIPTKSDVLGKDLTGGGLLSNENWGEDSVHVIIDPRTGAYKLWNHGDDAVIDATELVREPSTRPARVGLKKNRKLLPTIEAQNSFDQGPDEPPPWSDEELQAMGFDSGRAQDPEGQYYDWYFGGSGPNPTGYTPPSARTVPAQPQDIDPDDEGQNRLKPRNPAAERAAALNRGSLRITNARIKGANGVTGGVMIDPFNSEGPGKPFRSVSSAGNNGGSSSNGGPPRRPPVPPVPPHDEGPDNPPGWENEEPLFDLDNPDEVAQAAEGRAAARRRASAQRNLNGTTTAGANTPTPARNGAARETRASERRMDRERERTVIDNPAAFQRIKPEAGWLFESEDGDGNLRMFRAQRSGSGPSATVGWHEFDEQTGEFGPTPARNIPQFGTISDQGDIIAEISQADYNRWTQGRGRLTPIERAAAAVRENVGLGEITKLRRREFRGQARPVDPEGNAWEITADDPNLSGGKITEMSSENVSLAHSTAMQATSQALGSHLPSDPTAKIAAVGQRIIDNALEGVDKFVKDETNSGVSPDLARAHGDKFKQVVLHYAEAAARAVEQSMGLDYGVTSGDVAKITTTDTRLKSLGEVEALVQRSPKAAREIQRSGKTIEQIWEAGESFPVVDEEGNAFDIGSQGRYGGGWGRGRGGGREGGGLWAGKFGSMMYGMYMLGREWKMAMGAPMQEAEAYGQYVSSIGQIALPEGVRAASTDVGYTARQELGREYMGRGAYQTLGAFMDVPYLMSGYGDAPARLATTTGMATGVAGGLYMGGQMLGMMDERMKGFGEGMGKFGLATGIAIGATGIGLEAYNQFIQPEEPLTFSSLGRTYTKALIAERAITQDKGIIGAIEGIAAFGAGMMQTAIPKNLPKNPITDAFSSYVSKRNWEIFGGVGDNLTDPEKDILTSGGTPKEVKELLDAAGGIQALTGEDQAATVQAAAMQKRWTGGLDYDTLRETAGIAVRRGMATSSLETEAAQYANSMGYVPGTAEFKKAFNDYATQPDQTRAENMQFRGQRVAALGGQLQSAMGIGADFNGLGTRLIGRYGIQTQQQVGAAYGMANALQQYGAPLTAVQWDQVTALSMASNPYVGGVISGAMGQYMAAGGSTGSAIAFGGILSSAGMSNQEASIYDRMLSGDMGAYSHQAWQSGHMENAFFDRAGQMIAQTNGAVAMQVLNHWAPQLGTGNGMMTAAQFLGTGNQQIVSTFEQGGFYGLQKLANQKSYEASMASIGVQMKGIALQENYLWGNNASGTWDNPKSGSYWGIEDRMTALSRSTQEANFADQWKRMQTTNQFSIQRESNQFTRMQVNSEYQNFQFSQAYNQFQQSQQWAQADWQYQDTMRGLNIGWQMEDLNEGIRFSSGRQRRQLVRQRDRAALTENLEEGNIETQRDHQKQLWAQQEEQFQKQKQYMAEMQRLDLESFTINKNQRETFYKLDVDAFNRRMKEYEEEKKLQDELKDLQRKYQYDQIQLQKEAAGAQAAAAAAQKEINDAIAEGQKNWNEKVIGPWQEMNKYDNAFRLATATTEMMKMMNTLNTTRIDKLIQLIREIGTVNPGPRYGGEGDDRY
jgi:hypothetical protein